MNVGNIDHLHYLQYAIRAAMESKCQSKRGVVAWDDYGIISTGFNRPPAPFYCDGSAECRRSCSKTAVHAEQAALLDGNRDRLIGARMLHIKVVDGRPVASDGPSCLSCSKLMLHAKLAGMWLMHESGWKFYDCADFNYRSSTASEYLIWQKA